MLVSPHKDILVMDAPPPGRGPCNACVPCLEQYIREPVGHACSAPVNCILPSFVILLPVDCEKQMFINMPAVFCTEYGKQIFFPSKAILSVFCVTTLAPPPFPRQKLLNRRDKLFTCEILSLKCSIAVIALPSHFVLTVQEVGKLGN
jgi:hypothetical protein